MRVGQPSHSPMGFAPRPKPLSPTKDEMSNYLTACAEGRLQAVQVFIQNWPQQAGVHWTDSKMTGLLCAAKGGHLDIVNFLLDNGASRGDSDKDGANALMLAAQSGNEKLVEALLARKYYIHAQDNEGRTALHHYIFGNSEDKENGTVALLVRHGADVNHRTMAGVKPLQRALSLGRRFAFRTLLDLGADISDPMLSAFASQMDAPDFADMLQDEPARRQKQVDDAISAGIGNTMKVSKPFNLSKEPRKKEQKVPPAPRTNNTLGAESLARLARAPSTTGRSWVG